MTETDRNIPSEKPIPILRLPWGASTARRKGLHGRKGGRVFECKRPNSVYSPFHRRLSFIPLFSFGLFKLVKFIYSYRFKSPQRAAG